MTEPTDMFADAGVGSHWWTRKRGTDTFLLFACCGVLATVIQCQQPSIQLPRQTRNLAGPTSGQCSSRRACAPEMRNPRWCPQSISMNSGISSVQLSATRIASRSNRSPSFSATPRGCRCLGAPRPRRPSSRTSSPTPSPHKHRGRRCPSGNSIASRRELRSIVGLLEKKKRVVYTDFTDTLGEVVE